VCVCGGGGGGGGACACVCVCVCARARARVCVRACVCVYRGVTNEFLKTVQVKLSLQRIRAYNDFHYILRCKISMLVVV
jgi:hypothetical protein